MRVFALQDVVFSLKRTDSEITRLLNGHTLRVCDCLSLHLLWGRASGKRPRHAAASLPQGLQDFVGMRQAVRDSVVVLDK
jgi:hypothetical protein